MFYSHNSCLDAVDTIEDGPSTVCLCPAEATPTTSAYVLYYNHHCRRHDKYKLIVIKYAPCTHGGPIKT